MRNFIIVAGATMLGLLSGACSTIVEGTDQPVTIITQPAGAICTLERGGTSVAVVNPTPGTVQIDKSQDNIAILCSREEHQDSHAVLSSTFQSTTFGNILLGGFIGVAIDASSGAMNKYPSSVTVMLPPKEFTSPEKRDDFYDAAIAEVRRDAATAVRKVSESCSPDGKKGCDRTIKAIEAPL